jgi:hypothetical protein
MDVLIHVFLTPALVGGEWSASFPGLFTSKETAPSNLKKEARWAIDKVEKRKFLSLPRFEL